jgi:hypothetical protein
MSSTVIVTEVFGTELKYNTTPVAAFDVFGAVTPALVIPPVVIATLVAAEKAVLPTVASRLVVLWNFNAILNL